MDLPGITAILYTVAGVVGKGMWDRVWKNRDRVLERDDSRSEQHRGDLRAAYAQLIAAHSKIIDRGLYVLSGLQQLDQQREMSRRLLMQAASGPEQKQRAAESEATERALGDKIRELLGEYNSAVADRDLKAVDAFLLEEDPRFSTMIRALMAETVPLPMSPGDYERFRKGLMVQRERASELIRALAGHFAPKRWSASRNSTGGSGAKALAAQIPIIGRLLPASWRRNALTGDEPK